MDFLESGPLGLASSLLSKNRPLYVQYYITARCNLRCQQCNVIYANSDLREANTNIAISAIENLAAIGTNILLFTGGEPFMRKDLPELVGAAISNGIHPRIQTNGLASSKELEKCVSAGVKDISISLDSLSESVQDFLNGEFDNSWKAAISSISKVTQIFPEDSFCAFGCVFSPYNYKNVESVIRFASKIGWQVSLVPAHATTVTNPRAFSSFNSDIRFPEHLVEDALKVLDRVIEMKKEGFNVYDSMVYLENMKLFVSNERLNWRDRNNGECDAGSLYFAVMPDTSPAVCCDFRLPTGASPMVSEKEFVDFYLKKDFLKNSLPIVRECSGCLYGSYPEVSISARFLTASLERFREFMLRERSPIKPITVEELQKIADGVLHNES